MFNQVTNSPTLQLLQQGLNVSSKRQSVIANNIANVNTPGYKRQFVTFEEQMSKALDNKSELRGIRTDGRHFPINDHGFMVCEPVTVLDRGKIMRNDHNNVDVDMEMGDLAKNTMNYQIFANRVTGIFGQLNDVISRGGKV
jgi:flagellar basal-body rod protein FlgB